MTQIEVAISSLIQKHGTLRAAARAVNIDPAYMWRLRAGEKENPSDSVLRKLGLVKEVTYLRRK